MTMTNEERIEFYAQKILDIKARKEELEEAEKNHRAALADLLPTGETVLGEYKLNRRENKRFDAATAKKNLTPEQLEEISVLKPDAARAKALLEDEDLALCQKNFGSVVTVGLRND